MTGLTVGALTKSLIQYENILKVSSQIPTAIKILKPYILLYTIGLRQQNKIIPLPPVQL